MKTSRMDDWILDRSSRDEKGNFIFHLYNPRTGEVAEMKRSVVFVKRRLFGHLQYFRED